MGRVITFAGLPFREAESGVKRAPITGGDMKEMSAEVIRIAPRATLTEAVPEGSDRYLFTLTGGAKVSGGGRSVTMTEETFAVIAEGTGVDVWEAIRLANHHPRVNVLKPGPGVGGHCIAVDPWFLIGAAPAATRLIRAARDVNEGMPEHVLDRLAALVEPPAPIALLGMTYEINDFFARRMTYVNYLPAPNWQDLRVLRNFSFSALYMAYGAALMAVGFWRRSAFLRWQALVLLALTIGKVFTYDVWELEKGYRIISFIVLGVLLLAISFVYQRDWLKLSGSRADSGLAKGSSAS